MTTIVYRDGVMAADSRAWSGGHSPIGMKNKVHRLEDGTLVGCASSIPGAAEAAVQWYRAGADPKGEPPREFNLLVVRPDGSAYLADDNPYLSGPLHAPYFAIGSGRQFALGALAMGADAVEAVSIGIQLDTCSGGPITVMRHEEEKAE